MGVIATLREHLGHVGLGHSGTQDVVHKGTSPSLLNSCDAFKNAGIFGVNKFPGNLKTLSGLKDHSILMFDTCVLYAIDLPDVTSLSPFFSR